MDAVSSSPPPPSASESSFEFTLNGRRVRVEGAPPTTTLLQFLRRTGMTGSKEGCAEGDCGACTVAIVDRAAEAGDGRRATFRAINSCITLLPMVAGQEVWTVEGVGQDGPHPVQTAMVKHYGSQCGYCTPGFVVSMFEAFHRGDVDTTTKAKIADQLCGNLCRCTGYRPIRDAMIDALGERDAHKGDRFHLRMLSDAPTLPPLAYAARGQRFLRPTTLSELVQIRARHPEAELVAGATEIGVEINKKAKEFPFLVSTEAVAGFRDVVVRDDHVRIGGGATLSDLEEGLRGEFPEIDKMLLVFASRQIRHRATLSGNLVTASPIGDMAPVLLALDARLELTSVRGTREVPLDEFFVAYRKTVLERDEVVAATILPRRPAGVTRHVDSYKVSKRRELDISIVAVGFCVETDPAGLVTTARLGYGGVAATPVRARRTEAALIGKPWSPETARGVLPTLAEEFTPIEDVRSGVDYRRGLITGLFEKFALGVRSLAQDEPLEFEVGSPPAPAPPSLALKHESALGHACGSAQYVDDAAMRRPMLEIWPVTSPHAHARIVRRDATAARAMPGVVAVLFAADVPGQNDVGALRKDEALFADDEAKFHGHIVAIVVGESYAACRAAAAKVEVEYEPLPAILGVPAAISAESYHTEPHRMRRGDAAAAIQRAPRRLHGTLEIGGQEHFYLESQAAYAEVEDDGSIFVSSSTQHPTEIQSVISHVLHLPRSRITVQSPRMGGGFGGKETQGNTWAAIVALAAHKTGRSVRVQLDRDVDLALTGKRHPFHSDYEVGFDDDGRILGVKSTLVSDGGWALDLSESINDRALFHFDNSYYLPTVDLTGRVAKTNCVSHTAFRGFGGPQGMLVIEEILDRIARTLGLRPEVVRERNLYRGAGETNTTHYGQAIEDGRIEKIWRTLKESARFDERLREIAEKNAASPHVKRGIAITPVKFGISFTASFLNQAGALVLVYRDGTVQVNHGGTEMGQGLYTKMLGVAMRELGLPADRIRVMKTQTDKVPNTSPTAASSGADLNGAAVRAACTTIRERLLPVAARLLLERTGITFSEESLEFTDGTVAPRHRPDAAVSFETVVEAAYFAQISLSATGYYRTPGLGYDKKTGRGKPFHYFACGAAITEVEVDGLSGMKRVLRADILHDVGDSLNPGIDRGQIEGGYVQGMGWLTGEELKWDGKGRLLTHSASTYQIPAISDAPVEMYVALLPDAAQHNTVHGSKAVGEPPLMLAISAREAIRDAIAAFGAAGGLVELAAPATHEAIYAGVAKRANRAVGALANAAE